MPGGIASTLERRSNAVDLRDFAVTPEPKLQMRQASSSSKVPSSTSSGSGVSSTASPTPSSTSSTLTSTSSQTRQYTDLFPTGTPAPTPPAHRNTLPQTVLMWIFAIIAVAVIGILIIWRWSCVRTRRESRRATRRSSRAAFTRSDSSSRPNSLNISDMLFRNTWDRDTRPITLSPTFLHTGLTMPLVDSQGHMIPPPSRRVQALDVDAQGRRGGRPVGEDGEPEEGTYDELPAYDGKAPPGYTLEPSQQRARTGSRPQRRSAELRGASPVASSSGSPAPPGAVTPAGSAA